MGMSGPSHGPRKAMSEINVTPLVDVMLVLLIIFMVTAPMMKQGLNVNLPETKGTGTSSTPKNDPLVVTIKQNNTVFIGSTKVPVDLLADKIKSLTETIEDKQVFLEADKKVTYDLVARVMGEIQSAGVFRISLVTVPRDK
jgi:biopolymer transport protein TolR